MNLKKRGIKMSKSTNEQKAVIHILKNEYGITDTVYGDLMQVNFGVRSSIDLTKDEATRFIHLLNLQYNEDYKRGFEYVIQFLNLSDTKIFKTLVQVKYSREVTELEVQMFDNMTNDDKRNLIQSLM